MGVYQGKAGKAAARVIIVGRVHVALERDESAVFFSAGFLTLYLPCCRRGWLSVVGGLHPKTSDPIADTNT